MSIEKLIAVGRKATGEEAAAAADVAFLAASQGPGPQRSAPKPVSIATVPVVGTLHFTHLLRIRC